MDRVHEKMKAAEESNKQAKARQPKNVATLNAQIRAFESKEHKFAAILMRHFLKNQGGKAGDYKVTAPDRAEVYKKAKTQISKVIGKQLGELNRSSGSGGKVVDIVKHNGGDSNIRFTYVDMKQRVAPERELPRALANLATKLLYPDSSKDPGLTFAYGGADLDVKGSYRVEGDVWVAEIESITIGDTYEWDKAGLTGNAKQFISEKANASYDAALELEQFSDFQEFHHSAVITADDVPEGDVITRGGKKFIKMTGAINRD
jgi:hypothetical protein